MVRTKVSDTHDKCTCTCVTTVPPEDAKSCCETAGYGEENNIGGTTVCCLGMAIPCYGVPWTHYDNPAGRVARKELLLCGKKHEEGHITNKDVGPCRGKEDGTPTGWSKRAYRGEHDERSRPLDESIAGQKAAEKRLYKAEAACLRKDVQEKCKVLTEPDDRRLCERMLNEHAAELEKKAKRGTYHNIGRK